MYAYYNEIGILIHSIISQHCRHPYQCIQQTPKSRISGNAQPFMAYCFTNTFSLPASSSDQTEAND